MKPSNLQTGSEGEKAAAEYLKSKGYRILASNWKSLEGPCEIDIIAAVGDLIVFVEVKTRSSAKFGWPEKAVNAKKAEHIGRAAEAYMIQHGLDEEIRFDIVSINNRPDGLRQIYHIEDAFVPGREA